MIELPKNKKSTKPAFEVEKEVLREEIQSGIKLGVDKLAGVERTMTRPDSFHNTKYLLKQYRRIAYAVQMSEAELNLRMEMSHGVMLSTFEVNAELAGVDLSNTRLEGYAQSVIRSKNMLAIINSALECVKDDPDHGELYYQVLYQTYFTQKKPKNTTHIVQELDRLDFPMSMSSYYNYLASAIKAIDRILWGYTARDCIDIIQQFLPE